MKSVNRGTRKGEQEMWCLVDLTHEHLFLREAEL